MQLEQVYVSGDSKVEFTPVIHNGISKNIRVALKVKYNVTESLLG
ncbi:hypothetical protein VCHA28FP16_300039 [Vibrio chagasii]|nr:hypothetical protein VCHA28FP16_300039 [Vibrio chagasii]